MQPQAPADRLASKQGNQHAGKKKNAGTAKGNTGNPNYAKPLASHAGNAKGNTGNANNATPLKTHARKRTAHKAGLTLKLSGECYKQTPERHGCACSPLLTKLNTFNLTKQETKYLL